MTIFLLSWTVTIEGYYRPNPWIDTQTSSEYSEEKFNQIKIGMTKAEVIDILDKPWSVDWKKGGTKWNTKDSLDKVWNFTGDGKFDKGDFAWIGRALYFTDSGEVVEIYRNVHYD
jgi:hypothetical protein